MKEVQTYEADEVKRNENNGRSSFIALLNEAFIGGTAGASWRIALPRNKRPEQTNWKM
jgi:hypothetical protein